MSVSVRTIGDLIDARTIEAINGFPFGEHSSEAIGLPHIRPFNVQTTGEISLDQIKWIPTGAAIDKPRIRRNDIVFNNTNTKELVGKCAIWQLDLEPVFSNHMTRIRVLDKLHDPAYLSFAILHHWMIGKSEMLARAHVAQASIMGERFREIVLPWREPQEQRSISSVLEQTRETCRSQAQQERVLTELKRAAMRELFTRGLRGEPQKETEIGLIPESWRVVPFSSVRDWLQYGTSVRCSTEPGRYPVLRIPNIESGCVNPAELKYCDLEESEGQSYLLEAGDLLFIRTNGVLERLGSCAVYAGTPKNSLFASYLIRARLKRDLVDPRFVAFFLGSEQGTSVVAGRATPAADGKYNLNTGTIDSLPLPLPSSLNEQREIVAILDAIDRKIDLHKRKRAVLEELFQTLLHKLMTGEIRVSDLDLSALPPAAPVPQEASV